MYKVKLDDEERDAIRRGHVPTIVRALEKGDENVTKELKKQKGDVAFQQGVSHVIDRLLELMTSA